MLEANRVILDTLSPRIDGDVGAESTIEGRVVVESGASVVRSQIRGPVIVGEGAHITDSVVGPYVAVGDGCRIDSSEVDHSILLPGARLAGVRRATDSILGRGAEVVRDGVSPGAYRFMIGDDSSVGVI
jgi:glucose-1-phosphate thymidylyltransferase